jgi:hypothetical protein
VKSSPSRNRRHIRDTRTCRHLGLEELEQRRLLSGSVGFSIPGLPNIPGIPQGFKLPAFTNGIDLGSLSSYFDPPESDFWWLKNTGQTLSNSSSGPATGKPGADVAAYDAWNLTTGTGDVVIAVLDSGFDMENEELVSALWTNPGEIEGDEIDNDGNGFVDDIHGWNFLDDNNDLQDNFVHGTAVAAALHSVAPGISILPVQIGTAAGVSSQNVIDGINYVIWLKQHGVNVVAINASYISYTPPSMGEVNTIKSAGDSGMLYIAAAGNASMNLDSMIPDVPSFLQKYIPSFLPSNLIFVAATDNQDNLADFSNYGSRTVSVGAPGVDMTLALPGGLYAPVSGTSFAAPMVSAIAALLKSRFPTAGMGAIKDAILKSGDQVASLAGKTVTGRRVDAMKAINYMMGNQPPTGQVTVLSNEVISGWAFDANLGTGAATVKITMDGKVVATFAADQEQEGLPGTVVGANHGFSFDMSDTPYGKHVFKVYVVDHSGTKQVQIGQGNIVVNQMATGALENVAYEPPTARMVTGWAFDADTPTKFVNVKLVIDGKTVATGSANIDRPDLAGDLGTDSKGKTRHGYSIKLPTLKAGVHTVATYAVDTLTGTLVLLGSETLTVNRAATGAVETLNATTLSGWAFDTDAGAAPIQIMYQIDDLEPVLVMANVVRPDLQTSLKSKNHGFVVNLALGEGEHLVKVWAVDPNVDSPLELISQVVVVPAPLTA